MRYGLTGKSKIRGARVARMAPIEPGLPGAGSTRLPDNSYVLNSDLEAMKRKWPEGYKILTEQGFTAYSQAVADAKTAVTKQAVITSDITSKYDALTLAQKTPMTLVRRGPKPELPKSFTQVFSARTKDAIPSTPGFYTVTKTTTTESGGTPSPGPGQYMLGTWSKGITKTSLYARLEDGSLVLMGKTSTPWSKSREAGGGTGITHEQRLGASKLSKEMGVPYDQALGLVSKSGYYDKDAIVQLPGTHGYGIYDPKTGKRVWGAYTPEVASAIKKLKPFEKKDGSYDWVKLVNTDDTKVVVAIKQLHDLQPNVLKGVRESIKTEPKLYEALSIGGLETYSDVFESLNKELPGGDWVPIDIWGELPKHYQDIGLSKGYDAMEEAIRSDERILAAAGFSEVVDGETWYKVSEAISSNDPKVKAAIGRLFPSEEVVPTVVAIPAPTEAVPLKPTEWWNRLTPWTEEKGETLGNELAERVEIVKDKLKLTPNEIEEARQAFLHVEDPSILQKLAGSFKISDLWAYREKELTPEQEQLCKAIKEKSEELNKLPLAQQWVETKKLETNIGAAAFGQAVAVLPAIRSELKAKGVDLPAPLRIAAEVIGGVAIGAFVLAPIATGQIATELAKTAFVPQKGEHLKEIGVGIADFFISVPSMIAAEPAMASGELVGMFIIGPESALKFLKVTGAKGFPSYIPKRGMGIEYSVVKVPSKIAGKEAIVAAVNEGIKRALRNKSGETIVKIGDGSLRLKIRSTPFSEVVGPALWHATPELAKALQKGIVKGELYTSPHLAVRFAESSASGVPMTNPAILLIHTKAGKVKWRPSTNLYKGAKELEAIYGATRLQRVESLWSRLTFGKLGDFFTTSKGNIIPIYRFKEIGAKVPGISLLDLTIIRIETIKASLVDLIKGKKGFEIISESKSKMAKRIGKDIKKEVLKGKEIEDAHDIVFRREVRRLVGERPRLLERLYRRSPEIFEEAYRENLAKEFGYTIARTRLAEAPRVKHTPREDRVDIRRERLTITRRRGLERFDRQIRRLERLRKTVPRTRVEREKLDLRLKRIRLERENLRKKLQLDLLFRAGDKKARGYKGAVAWRQGALKRKGAIVPVYKVWRYPYRQEDLDTFFQNELPPGVVITPGGAKSAYKSIQLYKGKVPPVGIRQADIGAVLVTVKAPTPSPGKAGAITFKKDIKGIRGTSKESLRKLPLGTTLVQIVEGNYPSRIPRSTVDMILTNKLGKLSSKEIAEVLKSVEAEPVTEGVMALAVGEKATVTTGYTKEEVLKRLPDSKRREVERLLTETFSYAPTRGFPKFVVAKSKLSRKKKKVKSNSPQPIEPVAVATR